MNIPAYKNVTGRLVFLVSIRSGARQTEGSPLRGGL